MRSVLAVLAVTLMLLTACGRGDETVTYTNDAYGYSVDIPATWEVNKGQMAPPPPAGTSFEGDGIRVEIAVGKGNATEEQKALRQEGWIEEEITVAGEQAKSFTRPPADKGLGLWRRVYFEHNGLEYEISLNGRDEKQREKAHKIFADILASIRWGN